MFYLPSLYMGKPAYLRSDMQHSRLRSNVGRVRVIKTSQPVPREDRALGWQVTMVGVRCTPRVASR